jgi:hypothetical protein
MLLHNCFVVVIVIVGFVRKVIIIIVRKCRTVIAQRKLSLELRKQFCVERDNGRLELWRTSKIEVWASE